MVQPVIGFAGLTHLGLNSAVASAAKGFSIVGYHDDNALIAQLKNGDPHVLEPQLPELMKQQQDKMTFSSDLGSLTHCDIVYIAVDVPTDDNGRSNLKPIEEMIDRAATVMRKEASLVILCQVSPGFTRTLKWPADRLFYQVETLIFGRAIERALYPERFIVGCEDPHQPLRLELLKFLESFDCPILPMRYESAELAKISINMCLVASISTANTLAEICEEIGADWSEIVPALRLDKRIGPHSYLKPGLGISGGNLERDLATVLSYAEKHETDGDVVASWVANSKYRKDWVWRVLNSLVLSNQPNPKIAVLGLTYKENTHSIKNSPSIALLEKLKDHDISAFDPAAADNAAPSYVTRKSNCMEALDQSDVLLVMTPWSEFEAISTIDLDRGMRGRTIIDPYGILNGSGLVDKGFTYATLGKPVQHPERNN